MNLLLKNGTNQKVKKKWELIFHLYVDQNWWKKCYHLVSRLTRDIQLRWFQYRILHRVLATNFPPIQNENH